MPDADLKTVRIKLYPTESQKRKLDEFIDTSRYVYNKTLGAIKNGHRANFMDLRDLLVTEDTKKHHDEYKAFNGLICHLQKAKKESKSDDEAKLFEENIKLVQKNRRDFMKRFDHLKNDNVKDFELSTPKDVRACAVQRCCDAFKAAIKNLKQGNIKYFEISFKKKSDPRQTVELTPKQISVLEDGNFQIAPSFFGKDEKILLANNHLKGLKIDHNVDIVREKGLYYLHACVDTNPSKFSKADNVGSVDIGIRSLATVHTHDSKGETVVTEYKHRSEDLRKLNFKKNILKSKSPAEKRKEDKVEKRPKKEPPPPNNDFTNKKKKKEMKASKKAIIAKIGETRAEQKPKEPKKRKKKKRIRKKHLSKIEKRKSGLVERLQWDFVNDILEKHDVIYFGDIKSHDIVSGRKNGSLNQSFNDLKFYQLKQKLIYKAYVLGKKVIFVPEHYTTQTCSCCGELNREIGSKKVFECSGCGMVTDRDFNAAKNIKMKGFHQ